MKRKVIYIASRYSADFKEQFEEQLKITKEISREVVLAGHEVIVPHLYYPTFLDDDNEEERLIGTQSAIRLLDVCDVLFVHIGLGISKGMDAEIGVAKEKGMIIAYFRNTTELKDILKRLTSRDTATNDKVPHSKTPVEKCADCLDNNTAKGEPFPWDCTECSLYYGSSFKKRPKLDTGQGH